MSWSTSKRFRGVRVWTASDGSKTYYIQYKAGGKTVTEKIGSERDRITAQIAANVRTARRNAARLGGEAPKRKSDIPTMGEVAAAYLKWADRNKKSAASDRHRWGNHLEERFGHLRPDQVARRDVEKMVNELAVKLAPATVCQVVALLRAIFNRGRAWGMIDCDSPTHGVDLPRLNNTRERVLTAEECAALLSALRPVSEVAWSLALVSLNTGARRGELFSLRWRDVDFDQGVIRFLETKNGRTRRIPINETVRACLAGIERRSDWVFAQRDGSQRIDAPPVLKDAMDRLFNADVTDRRHRTTFHTLRHTAASRLVAAGVPLNVVQELLGHRSLKMLERYAHLLPNATRAAVEVLGG